MWCGMEVLHCWLSLLQGLLCYLMLSGTPWDICWAELDAVHAESWNRPLAPRRMWALLQRSRIYWEMSHCLGTLGNPENHGLLQPSSGSIQEWTSCFCRCCKGSGSVLPGVSVLWQAFLVVQAKEIVVTPGWFCPHLSDHALRKQLWNVYGAEPHFSLGRIKKNTGSLYSCGISLRMDF